MQINYCDICNNPLKKEETWDVSFKKRQEYKYQPPSLYGNPTTTCSNKEENIGQIENLRDFMQMLDEAAKGINNKEMCSNCMTVLIHLLAGRKKESKELLDKIEKMYEAKEKDEKGKKPRKPKDSK